MATSTEEIDGEGEEGATTTDAATAGLDENVAGALSYLFGFLSGVVFYLIDDRAFVRFHAAQSMAVSAVLFVAYAALSVFQIVVTAVLFNGTSGGFVIGSIVSLVLGLVWLVLAVCGFALWVYLLVRAYQGETPRIPVAAGIADRLV